MSWVLSNYSEFQGMNSKGKRKFSDHVDSDCAKRGVWLVKVISNDFRLKFDSIIFFLLLALVSLKLVVEYK